MGEDRSPDPNERVTGVSGAGAPILQFGEFTLDRSARCLTRGEKQVRIQQKPLDVLIYLAENRSRLVTREELLDRFWPPAVNEEALTRCISTLRKRLGDVRDPSSYIETLWGQGYRFVSTVVELQRDTSAASDVRRASGIEQLQPPPRSTDGRRAPFAKASIFLTALGLIVLLGLWTGARQGGRDKPDLAIDRIAVIPIAAPDDEAWIASALTDQLNLTVSRIEGITVTARGSASRFSATSDPIEVGDLLGVDALLISELRRSEAGGWFQSELVSTLDGSVLWSFQVEPSTSGTEKEQINSLARAIAGRLWANLQLREPASVIDPVAYRHYLRGRYYWNQRSRTGLLAAIESFEAALELEPDYVDALIGLADSWLLMPLYGAMAPTEAIPRSRMVVEQALALDPSASHGYAVTGVIEMQYDWDWEAAEKSLRKAVTLNPNDATAEQWLGELYCYRRRFEDCRRQFDLATGLDPLSPVLQMLRGTPFLYSGRFAPAAEAYHRALRENPGFTFSQFPLGHAYVGLRRWDRAIESYEASLPGLGLEIVGGPLILARANRGDLVEARSLLSELEELADERYVPPTKFAIAHIGLGDRELAIEWLWRAIEEHDDRLVYLAVDSVYSDLYSEPDFSRVATHIGLAEVLGVE